MVLKGFLKGLPAVFKGLLLGFARVFQRASNGFANFQMTKEFLIVCYRLLFKGPQKGLLKFFKGLVKGLLRVFKGIISKVLTHVNVPGYTYM